MPCLNAEKNIIINKRIETETGKYFITGIVKDMNLIP